ncbi:MAG: hypothetical protein PHV85_04860, partial [Desulfovibrionaceae bacterium]|nr:hypothetical protein [Desulfovibrionaceae bacterium]
MCVNPAIPLGPQNLLLGLTSLRFRTFLWATAAFLYPPVLAFTIIGHATGGFILQGGVEKAFRLVIWVSLAVTLLVVGRIAVRRAAGRKRKDRG